MESMNKAARDFFGAVVKASGLKPTQVAKAASTTHATFNKVLDGKSKHNVSLTTVQKVETYCVKAGLKPRFRDFLATGDGAKADAA